MQPLIPTAPDVSSLGVVLALERLVLPLRNHSVAPLCRLGRDVGEHALLLGREASERRLIQGRVGGLQTCGSGAARRETVSTSTLWLARLHGFRMHLPARRVEKRW